MMTRNTRKALEIVYNMWSNDPSHASEFDTLYSALKRLAQYEESAMSPEEVQGIAEARRQGKIAYMVCGTVNGRAANAGKEISI